MKTIKHCPVCGSQDIQALPAHFDAWFLQRMRRLDPSQPYLDVALNHCQACDYGGVNHRFTVQEEAQYYQNYMKGEYLDGRGLHQYAAVVYNEHNKKIRRDAAEQIMRQHIDVTTITSVLDYGGHSGDLIPSAFDGIRRAVFDYDQAQMLPNGVEVIDSQYQGKFDLVMSAHTLEHASDIDGMVERLKELTRPGGWIYIEVPAEFAQNFTPNYGFHEHINLFTVSSLRALASKHQIQHKDIQMIQYPHIFGQAWVAIGQKSV
jgi:SAM-dependent methyltransferase